MMVLEKFSGSWRAKRDAVLLAGILVFGFLFRVYGIAFPLYHWDEKIAFDNVMYASAHHLALLIYEHGSFLQYLILLLWDIRLLLSGVAPNTRNLISLFYSNMTPFLVLARLISVFASTGTLYFTYLLGKQAYSKKVGLFASFFLAFNFLHSAHSHYARGHILSTFFAVLALYFSLYIFYEGDRKYYLLTGMSIALSTASQYSGILLLAVLLAAHFLRWRHSPARKSVSAFFLDRSFLLALNVAALTFFLVTPYALLDFTYFSGEMKWFLTQTLTDVHVATQGQSILSFYLTEHLKNGAGIGIEVLAFLGIGYAFFKHRYADILLLIFPSLLFLSLSKGENFARYALPLLPFFMLFAARLLVELSEKFSVPWRDGVLLLISLWLVFPSLQNIMRFDYWITQPDTRAETVTWFEENVPGGTTVVSEGMDVLAPNLPLDSAFLDEILARTQTNSFSQTYLLALRENAPETGGYRFKRVFVLNEEHQGGKIYPIKSAEYYQEQGIEYLITVSWMRRSPEDAFPADFKASLDELYQVVKVFEPTIPFRWDPYAWRIDYDALSHVRLGESLIGGPRITIYRLR